MAILVTAVAVMLMLTLWQLRMRRHPAWALSSDARFYISLGYPMVALAAYWFTAAPTDTGWEWVVGNAWALAAMLAFVKGSSALRNVVRRQHAVSRSLETIPAGVDARAPGA